MAPYKKPPEEGTPAHKVHKKLETIDSVGRVIYKFAKKWVVGIISLITVLSIWLGIDIFGKMGIKNPSTIQPSNSTEFTIQPEREFKEVDLSEEYLEDLEESGYHLDTISEYYDSTADYAFKGQMQQTFSPAPSKHIVEMLFDVDKYGDTLYIDIYSDGTDSIYYPKKGY